MRIDDNGVHHFIVIPVTTSFDVWSQIPGRIYIDANNDTEITERKLVNGHNVTKRHILTRYGIISSERISLKKFQRFLILKH